MYTVNYNYGKSMWASTHSVGNFSKTYSSFMEAVRDSRGDSLASKPFRGGPSHGGFRWASRMWSLGAYSARCNENRVVDGELQKMF